MPKYFQSPKHHFSNEHQVLCSCATKDRIPGHTRVGSGNPIVFCRNCGGIFYQSIVDNYLRSEQFLQNDLELLTQEKYDSIHQYDEMADNRNDNK